MSVLAQLALVFGLAVVVLLVCHRLRIPPILGFLITGVAAGPHGLGLVSAVHEVEVLAEVGVVLLLFTIGLELPPSEIARLGRTSLKVGGAQVAVTVALFAGLTSLLGLPANQALFAGFLVSLSSTAIVLRAIQEMGETESPHGRLSLAILLFQDLAVVPMLLLAPLLAGSGTDVRTIAAQGLGLLAVAVVFLAGRKIVPLLLHAVVRTRSREAFLLATLVLCLAIALGTAALGLSLALGAFLAGLIVANSRYSLSALQGVLPFRDVFTSLFFVSVGMLLDLRILVEQPLLVLGGTLVVIAGKALVGGGVVLASGYPLRPAILAGASLAQVGEFAFVLAQSGLRAGVIDESRYQVFLAASVVTMMLTPLWITAAPQVARLLLRLPVPARLKEGDVTGPNETQLADHMIIVGYGLGGRHLARAARQVGIAHKIVEMNPVTVREEARRGEPIVHGDATLPTILEHVGIHRARVMAVVISDPTAIRRIVEVARRENPALHLVVRTRFVTEVEPLRALGADDVVAEEFETSVEVFTRVLAHCLVPQEEITAFTDAVRSEGYAILREPAPSTTSLVGLRAQTPNLDVVGLTVAADAPVAGLSLLEADLRRTHEITVLATRRGQRMVSNPHGTWRLAVGDVVWIFGEREAVTRATELFRPPAPGVAEPAAPDRGAR